jgi:hypothetical protein
MKKKKVKKQILKDENSDQSSLEAISSSESGSDLDEPSYDNINLIKR